MKKRRIIFASLIIIGLVVLYAAMHIYKVLYYPEIKKQTYVFIPTGSKFIDVEKILINSNLLSNVNNFEIVAKWKKYDKHIHPGKYLLKEGMSLNNLINLLRSGSQVPVDLKIENFRTIDQLIKKVSSGLEANPDELSQLLNDEDFLSKYNVNRQTAISLFIPNTYQFFWNTSAKQFIEKMNAYYTHFWNDARKEKALRMNMSQSQVTTLASIVQLETTKPEEMSTIAGVYYNRLRKGMMLQSDPTVIFALGNFNIHRLYFNQLKIDSPYNTYKYKGLPPGPICMPNAITIDRVLNHDNNDYLYFCAKDDLSGYHNFAKSANEHMVFASKYRSALNKRGITN